jgi:hypothetical protein
MVIAVESKPSKEMKQTQQGNQLHMSLLETHCFMIAPLVLDSFNTIKTFPITWQFGSGQGHSALRDIQVNAFTPVQIRCTK